MKPLTVKLCSIFTCCALAATLVAWKSSSPQEKDVKRTGVITAWVVAADGAITFRVDGRQDEGAGAPVTGKPGGQEKPKEAAAQGKEKDKDAAAKTTTWFITAPDKNAFVRLEELVLQIILSGSSGSAPITVTAKYDAEGRGETMEKPLFLKTIGRL